jgi:hypothetical protein
MPEFGIRRVFEIDRTPSTAAAAEQKAGETPMSKTGLADAAIKKIRSEEDERSKTKYRNTHGKGKDRCKYRAGDRCASPHCPARGRKRRHEAA